MPTPSTTTQKGEGEEKAGSANLVPILLGVFIPLVFLTAGAGFIYYLWHNGKLSNTSEVTDLKVENANDYGSKSATIENPTNEQLNVDSQDIHNNPYRENTFHRLS